MASKIFKSSQLYSLTSGSTPTVSQMIAGELALNLHPNFTHLWASDGTQVIDLGARLGGSGDEKTVHTYQNASGSKEISSLVYLKDVTAIDRAAGTLPSNVEKRYRLVDADGNNIELESGVTPSVTADTDSANIDILKNSSITEIYLGTKYDSVNSGTGVVTKYHIGDVVTDPDTHESHTIDSEDFQYLNFVYVNENSEYSMTQINLREFLVESEFASGVTFDAQENKVRGVVNPLSDVVITAWTAGDESIAGVSAATEDAFTLDEDGFKVAHIQDAINAKHGNTIYMSGYTTGATDIFDIQPSDTIVQAIYKIEDELDSNGTGVAAGGGVEADNTGIVFRKNNVGLVILSAGTF